MSQIKAKENEMKAEKAELRQVRALQSRHQQTLCDQKF